MFHDWVEPKGKISIDSILNSFPYGLSREGLVLVLYEALSAESVSIKAIAHQPRHTAFSLLQYNTFSQGCCKEQNKTVILTAVFELFIIASTVLGLYMHRFLLNCTTTPYLWLHFMLA